MKKEAISFKKERLDLPTECDKVMHMKTELSKAGYGTHVSVDVKDKYFHKDLAKLLKAYDMILTRHWVSDHLCLLNKGECFADGHRRLKPIEIT